MLRKVLFSIVIYKQDGIPLAQCKDTAGQKGARFSGYLAGVGPSLPLGIQAFVQNTNR